jgi:hypothetical protein
MHGALTSCPPSKTTTTKTKNKKTSAPAALPKLAPLSLGSGRSWASDLCHLPGCKCTPQGRLLALRLPAAGLVCAGFPPEFGQMPALQTLDLTMNTILNAGLSDVGAALKPSKSLRRLYLANTGLSGPLACSAIGAQLEVCV